MAVSKSGCVGNEIRVVVMSKTKPMSVIRQLYGAGHRYFGEDNVEELVEKAGQLPADIQWHFLGNLKTMRVIPLLTGVPNLAMVESVDCKKIASRLDHVVANIGRKTLKVLLQVNTSGRESLISAVEPSGYVELAKFVTSGCPNLEFCGLMTIGMLDGTSAPENFKTLANCRTEVCQALGIPEEKCELSMGMSADFEQAIELGCTNVRTESPMFGPREYPQERTQVEENNPDPIPMIVDNSAARRNYPLFSQYSSKKKRKVAYPWTMPITFLDPWNARDFNMAAIERTDISGMDKSTSEHIKKCKERINLGAGKLRETYPDYIPVTVEKEASSDLPDIDMKKYLVGGVMPLGEFVHAIIRSRTRLSRAKPVYVYFKNTEPPTDALMSAIDEENKDEDGFLHITYTGEGKARGSINYELEWLEKDRPEIAVIYRSQSLVRQLPALSL